MANQEPNSQANQTERDNRNNNINHNDDNRPACGRLAQKDEMKHDHEQTQDRNSENIQQQQQVLRPRQVASHRPVSFAPPFPVPVGGPQSIPTSQPLLLAPASIVGTPLTNHEIYELIQRHQQQQQASFRASQPSVLSGSGGSFKRSKRQSLYGLASSINRGATGNKLERQSSIIVGTPSFQERYGKLFEQ